MSIKQLAMVIDAEKCIDCKACQAACKVANSVPDGYWRNWIKDAPGERRDGPRQPAVFQPGNCMQCDRPLCVEACPTGATYKNRDDGTVRIDDNLCIGCGQCLPACPYGARFRNPEKRRADKCDFCAERRSAGLEPACVASCPTKARTFGDLGDSRAEVHRLVKMEGAQRVINPNSDTKPNIYYLGNPGAMDWPREARLPDAYEFWRRWVGPAAHGLLLLSGLGVGAMFLKQLLLPGDRPVDEPRRKEDKHD